MFPLHVTNQIFQVIFSYKKNKNSKSGKMKIRRNLNKVSKTMNNGTLIYQMEADHLKKFNLNTKKCSSIHSHKVMTDQNSLTQKTVWAKNL